MQDAPDISLKFETLSGLCQNAAEDILRQQELLVVSHVDADGLTASAIICTALERLNKDYKPLFFRQLDGGALDEVADLGADLVIFTDLGSGMIQEICDRDIQAVVADHHKPAACLARPLAHINPHLVGADGATELSGSGTSFLLARALASAPGSNDDLAALAVVGAVGDLQDMASGRLQGLNRRILEIGSNAGAVSFSRDIKLFGRQTRPVYKMLEYSQDPYLPGLSGKEDACIAFLKDLGIRAAASRI
jgi:RecJ-like exonuclease